MSKVMPHNLNKLKLYQDRVPLFTRYQIESQIESAFTREVSLPSGGSIVIDHTEALISIDINSARATKGSDIEETALNTNLEAAEEIARQLRLRDLGGLVVIDFIDMTPTRNQREVENRLKEALKADRARIQVGRISRFGLLEMSRQRLRPSLGESSQMVCPRCSGQGVIRGVESSALAILRIVEEEAMKEKTARVLAQVPVDVATFLLNEKRDILTEIEKRQNVNVLLIPNSSMETPHYEIVRIREGDASLDEKQQSYEMATGEAVDVASFAETTTPASRAATEEPAVKSVVPATPRPAPSSATPTKPGLFVRIWRALFATGKPAKKKAKTGERRRKQTHKTRRNGGGQQQRRAGGGKQRQPRQPQQARKQEQPQKESAEEKKTPSSQQGMRDKAGSGSRRGRRGGRRRRQSDEGGQQQSAQQNAASADVKSKPAAQDESSQPKKQAAESTPAKASSQQDKPSRENKQETQSQPVAAQKAQDKVKGESKAEAQEAKKEQPQAAKAAATEEPAKTASAGLQQVSTTRSRTEVKPAEEKPKVAAASSKKTEAARPAPVKQEKPNPALTQVTTTKPAEPAKPVAEAAKPAVKKTPQVEVKPEPEKKAQVELKQVFTSQDD
jgi:ribonuclease E